jgi:signal transduction histidine kinase
VSTAAFRPLRPFSIRAKLIGMVMLTTCLALGLAGGSLSVFEVVSHRRALAKELETIAAILAENSTAALTFENAGDAASILRALASQTSVVSGCLYSQELGLLASYTRSDARVPCPAQPEGEPQGFLGETFVLHHSVSQKGRPLGTLRLVASLVELRQRLEWYAGVLLVVLVGAALGALGLSSGLQRVVSRPIFDLARTARQISERRDYTLRAPRRTEDEVGVAVAAFNQMLDRIQDADIALRQAEAELRALNATLEERVAERTAAAEQRAEELRLSNVELERFAYVASHDLQEPLRAVASYTQLLRSKLQGKLDGDAELYLGHVVAGATRMRSLINDLLDYSRLGRVSLDVAAVDSGAVLQTALSNLHAAIAESGAVVEPGPLPEVAADAAQLVQLFQNLVANAIHFRGEAPPRITVTAAPVGAAWRFAVADNGIGIERRFHEKIFVIFQRLHGRERPGTGIGLAICRKIVDRHGGKIWVESELGQGSTFFFTLPARTQERRQEPGQEGS